VLEALREKAEEKQISLLSTNGGGKRMRNPATRRLLGQQRQAFLPGADLVEPAA